MLRTTTTTAAALAIACASVLTARAQDAGALVDALVRKGVLTDQEAEEIRADMTREFATTPAGKIKLNDSITELKLYGDLRLRYQYDNRDPQADPFGVGVNFPTEQDNPSGSQRSRWRFRLRLNADFKVAENFFGGVELQTAIASDSANQTYENGFNDYPIFISKAYLGWNPNDWLTVTAGKFTNPFYTTDLVWDADVNPNGIAERVDFHKMYFRGGEVATGYSKDGKAVAAPSIREEGLWELSLVAGQFIFDDNLEGGGSDISGAARDNDLTTDAYLFQTQLIGSYKFNNGIKVTLAPSWMVFTAGSLSGLENENSFQDNALVSGATRNLNIITAPGDVSFKLGQIKTKVYWDLAYNIEGRKRAEDIYNLVSVAAPGDDGVLDPDDLIKNHSNRDDLAFLIGLQLGENKKKGDWSALVNYRQTGIAAVDPNLNDSDFALGELNTRGFKFGLAYNLTDFAIFAVTYMKAWQLRDIRGGEATGGNAIADSNDVDVLQVDLNMKF